MSGSVRRLPLPWALVGALALLVACRGGLPPEGQEGAPRAEGTPDEAEAGAPPTGSVTPGSVTAETDLPAAPGDERADRIARAWPDTVAAAVDRLASTTGLDARAHGAPRVVLRPFGDEDRALAITYEIRDGRRRERVDVNLELLTAGRRVPVELVAEGLAAAVYEAAGARGKTVAPWVVAAARIRTGRGVAEAVEDVVRGDTTDAETTGIEALLLLREAGEETTRRFFRFVAEGDAPDPILARLVHDPLGAWQGEGRRRLEAAKALVDAAPYRLVEGARKALAETGPAGLESALPDTIPEAAAAEVAVLQARAATSEGDHERARRLLRALPEQAWGRLADPAGALATWIQAEDRPGGDPTLASRLKDRYARDFPKAAREAARVPAGAGLDVVAARFRLAKLLQDHRPGAARVLLATLGESAMAPELEGVRLRVARAEESPSAEALAANRRRVEAWIHAPTDVTASDVRDGGAAAAAPLAEALAAGRVAPRGAGVDLLASTVEPGKVVSLLAPSWERRPGLLRVDLDQLLARIDYRALKLWVEGRAAGALAREDAATLWSGLRYGLDPGYVDADPSLLRDLRSPAFARRRAAFTRAVDAEEATPELVARALSDPAILLRREGAIAAGRLDFRALLSIALQDEAWAVRQAAVPGIAASYGAEANRSLLPLLASDPSPQVRMAAASALRARGRPSVADALLRALDDPHPGVRHAAQTTFLALGPADALPAIHRALVAEGRSDQPRAAAYARLFALFERFSGWRAAFYPGMPADRLGALVDHAGSLAGRVVAAAGRGPR